MKVDLIAISVRLVFIFTKENGMHSVNPKLCVRRIVQATAIASLLISAGFSPPVLAQTTNDVTAQTTKGVMTQPTKAEMDAWSESIKHIPKPAGGCFHISYPSLTWTKVDCGPEPTYRATPLMPPPSPPPPPILQKSGDPVQ